MVKVRFREKIVNDGDEIELPDGVSSLSIHIDRGRAIQTIVTWLEEVKD